MKLFELFDKPYKQAIDTRPDGTIIGTFATENGSDFMTYASEMSPGMYTVGFGDLDLGDDDITGSQGANSAKIFSTVLDFIEHHVPAEHIEFSADQSPSRQKLYRALGKTMARKKGWEYNESPASDGSINYILSSVDNY